MTNVPDGVTIEPADFPCWWIMHCDMCEWTETTSVALGPAGTPLHDRLAAHVATHQEPPC